MSDRLLSLPEVERKVSLGRSTIYRRIARGTFPRPVKLGEGCVRWRESAIDNWIVSLPSTGTEPPASVTPGTLPGIPAEAA